MSKRDFLRYSLAGLGCMAATSMARASFLSDEKGNTGNASEKPWKWSKESPYYTVNPHGVRCTLCPNQCLIAEGNDGICHTRENHNNKLFSIAYGNPCAAHVDPIEKKPLFHFLPGSRAFSIATAGCNLNCLNCQNWNISQASPRETQNLDLMPADVVSQAIANNCKTIAYTYTEPTVFIEYAYDTAIIARNKGVKNIFKSSGYINEKPLRDMCRYLDAANIDLKSFSNDVYTQLNGGTLQPVLKTLQVLKEEGVWLEITNLLVPGYTDNMFQIESMCKWLVNNGFVNYPLHFSRFSPGYKLAHLPATSLGSLEKAKKIALDAGMKFVFIGNVPGTNYEDTLCPHCGKTVIERRGFSVLANNIVNSKCKFCSTPIPGIWQ